MIHDPSTLNYPFSNPLIHIRPFTDKQLDVLVLIASDYGYKQIAEKLGISAKTVSAHATAGYKKIGVNTAVGATRYLIQHGYVLLPKVC